jgi:hypothetical protein
MRNGQKRMRGRSNNNNNNNNNNNHRKSQNPLTRVYESNGPDVKIRGTASHIAEKYMQLARDAQGSGDPVAAENYYQHAEHYFRLIAAAQEQFRQQNPYYNNPAPVPGAPQGAADDNYDDEGDDAQPFTAQADPGFAPQPQQGQPFPPRDQVQNRPQQQPQYQPQPSGNDAAPEVGGLPAFITGGGQPQQASQNAGQGGNGHDQGDRPDRFGRRRRRHRGGGGFRPDRPDFNGNTQDAAPVEGGGEPPSQPD